VNCVSHIRKPGLRAARSLVGSVKKIKEFE